MYINANAHKVIVCIYVVGVVEVVCVGWELFMCPYPLKVQARPPQDQRPALRSRVLGQGEVVVGLFMLLICI